MFLDDDPTYRFLIADEVGLGKTHIAKGVVAQVIDHLQDVGDERHDVVYVCSNGAIARQNLRKLVPKGIQPLESVERLTMLPLTDLHRSSHAVNLLAITPGTSLELGSSTGRFEERALAHAFLREAWDIPWNKRARWIFWEGIDPDTGDDRLRNLSTGYRRRIRAHLDSFVRELGVIDGARHDAGAATTRETFESLVESLSYKREFPTQLRAARRGLIGDVRRCMALVGIQLLDPDLVILDEFQRFKDLLDPSGDSWATQLANRLFTHVSPSDGRPTRTLLLSATPYRMYSIADEAADDHYDDFISTCGFLMDDPQRVALLSNRLTELRRALTAPDGLGAAKDACRRIERELRSVMTRTERLAATPDRAGMLAEPSTEVSIEATDVLAYLRFGQIAEAVRHAEPSEYWKSSPYLLNFMEQYKLKQDVDQATTSTRAAIDMSPGPGILEWTSVDEYKRIDPQNGRMRWLIEDLESHGAFDLLWIPPSAPYYTTGSVYERPECQTLTKRLIFSGWAVVPKVVSTLVSHEAERRAFAPRARQRYSDEYSARGGQRLEFTIRSTRPDRMSSFLFVWPSAALARLGNPRPVGPELRNVGAVREAVQERLRPEVDRIVRGAANSGAPDQRWYWLAPLLLDERLYPSSIDAWFGVNGVERSWTEAPGEGFERHAHEAWDVLIDDERELGRPPDDLLEMLTDVAIGSPAVCALRSLSTVTGLALDDPAVLGAAARCAWGFRSLFNAPDVTALVAAESTDGAAYWRNAIAHAIDGNLQALLDEHAHVLREWLGFVLLDDNDARAKAAKAIGENIASALDVRTSSYRVDVAPEDSRNSGLEERRMRGRFAVPFGNQRLEDGGEARVEAVSTAFNSPFWPFVLTSTSVGQEGLDFHLWCHAVVHWNLPANPVDLEQREGRVHRFKGHAVRRNLAAAYGARLFEASGEDPWDRLFALAAADRASGETEMHPFWVFNGEAHIQRLAPVLPFSRDAVALPRLRRSLAAYRLAIGQPRQEELVEYLERTYTSDEIRSLLDELRIDLTPPLQPSRYPPSVKVTSRNAGEGVSRELATHDVVQRLVSSNRGLLGPVLEHLADLGCLFLVPPAVRPDYVNVRAPRGHGKHRLLALTLASGRIELQARSWPAVVGAGETEWFDHVPGGDKAAITITSADGAAAAMRGIDAYLAMRRRERSQRRSGIR